MKTFLALLAAVGCFFSEGQAAAVNDSATNFVAAASPQIVVEGRCVKTAGGTVRLGFPGTYFRMRVRGGSVTMRVNASSDEVYFDVQVDGTDAVRLRCHSGEGDYPLLENVTPAEHLLEITRRSESWEGTCEVPGFSLSDGTQLLPPPTLPERKLMFIGDSITCGTMAGFRPDDPLNGRTPHNEHTSDALLSFGKILARRLNAQCHLVSYGGRGVIRDWQGFMTVRNAPQFYELALPDDPSILWNPADYVPDVVVICLGTNDFNQGVPDQNVFVNAYVEFVRKIRRDAPHARIFLADSPMLEDAPGKVPKRSVLHAYIREVIEKINRPDVMLAPIRHYAGVPNNGHPTAAEHEAIAGELEPLIRKALNRN